MAYDDLRKREEVPIKRKQDEAVLPGCGGDPHVVVRNWLACLSEEVPDFRVAQTGLLRDAEDLDPAIFDELSERFHVGLPRVARPIPTLGFAVNRGIEEEEWARLNGSDYAGMTAEVG